MKKQVGIFICLSFVVVLPACKKDKKGLIESYPAFDGDWFRKEAYTDGDISAYFYIYKTKQGARIFDYATYSGGGGEFPVEGAISFQGNMLTIKDDYSFIKKKHAYTVNEFPTKVNTPPSEDWWTMKVDGVDYYCNRNSSYVNSCNMRFLEVMNTGSDTIHAIFDGNSETINPGESRGVQTCFGCQVTYNDNHSNSFTYTIIGCDSKVEVH
jgi:hypothetical protein